MAPAHPHATGVAVYPALFKEGHAFSFLKKSFSMQIKNFLRGLSSNKKKISWKKSYFYPLFDIFYTV